MRQDLILHFLASGALTLSIAGGLHWHGLGKKKALAIGVASALSIGIAKEIHDERFDRSDMAANVTGVSVAVISLKIPLNRKNPFKKL